MRFRGDGCCAETRVRGAWVGGGAGGVIGMWIMGDGSGGWFGG